MPQQSNSLPQTVPKCVFTESVRCLSRIDVYFDYSDYFEDRFPWYNSIFISHLPGSIPLKIQLHWTLKHVWIVFYCLCSAALGKELPLSHCLAQLVSPACCRSRWWQSFPAHPSISELFVLFLRVRLAKNLIPSSLSSFHPSVGGESFPLSCLFCQWVKRN